MARTVLALCLAALMLVLAGCVPAADPDEARLCRIALAAGVDAPSSIEILRQAALPHDETGTGVRIAFSGSDLGGIDRAHWAECRFKSAGRSAVGDDLVAFRSDTGELTPATLYFLKRFWIGTAEGQAADPQPVANWSRAVVVSPMLAHALQDIVNALPAMATYAMLSAAYSLVYGLVNRINLAFGEMAAIGGAASLVGAGFLSNPGSTVLVLVCIGAAVWATTIHGVAIARVVFQPLRRATGQQGLVATIGLALVLNEYLRLAQGPTPLWMPPLGTTPIAIAKSGDFAVTITPLALELTACFGLAVAAVLLVMSKSQYGRNWRALADDPKAAALLGVDANRIFAQTFAIASALAGAAGGVVVLVYGSFGASFGAVIGLKGLLAAVIGGIGSVGGAFIGGIAISVIEAVWSAFFPVEYRDLVLFSLLVVGLVVRPGGFFGYRELGPRLV